MFVGISNEQPLDICARVGVATALAYARVTSTMAYTYRVCIQWGGFVFGVCLSMCSLCTAKVY